MIKRDGRSQCATCRHPRVNEINLDLYEGKLSLLEIADKYDNYVHYTSIGNHRRMHMRDYVPPLETPVTQVSKNDVPFIDYNSNVKSRSSSKIVTPVELNVKQSSITGSFSVKQPVHITEHSSEECHTCHACHAIDDMILDTKVKSIVLITLKELGIK